MSTQQFHFLTIVGRSANDIESAIIKLLKRGKVVDKRLGPTEYSPAAELQITKLCNSILEKADSLPVLHYATHIDGWALGNTGLRRIDTRNGNYHALLGLNFGIVYYPANLWPIVRDAATRARRRAARRKRRWDSWYEDAVALAFAAGDIFTKDYGVTVIAKCIDSSREDDDVHRSMNRRFPWPSDSDHGPR